MAGYAIRLKTHDIFAEWTEEDGVCRRARVGIRHDEGGRNREIMDADSFPLEGATIIAVPVSWEADEAS